ncbi:MAG: hypothetical protein HY905_21985 [Deltaproteobacteria bacterium]|nr:hypothetical protein [Deltaproteobacteria bacterium]
MRSGTSRTPEPALPPVPVGLHRLLRLAAVDAEFRERLVVQRDAAASAAGVRLHPSEKAMLRAVGAEQLEQLAVRMPPPRPEQATRLRQIAANAVLLLGGAALLDGVACRKAEPAATGGGPDAVAVAEAVSAPVPPAIEDVAVTSGDAAQPSAAEATGQDAQAATTDAESAAEGSGEAATAEADGGRSATDGDGLQALAASAEADLDEYCRRQEERLMQTGGGAAPDLPECYPPPDVSVTLAAVAIDGPLAEEQVRTVLRRVTSALPDLVRKAVAGMSNLPGDPCEDRRFRRDYDKCPPVAAGEVTVVLLVAPDGTVDGVRLQSVDALGEARSDVGTRLHGLFFPETDAPSQVTATWNVRPAR